jgi:hypothetical protein
MSGLDYGARKAADRVSSTGKERDQGTGEAKADRETATQTYQGLPAKFELPSGTRRAYFQREMLATDAPLAAGVVLLSTTALALLSGILLILVVVLVLASRQPMLAGWRTLWHKARQPHGAPPGPSGQCSAPASAAPLAPPATPTRPAS